MTSPVTPEVTTPKMAEEHVTAIECYAPNVEGDGWRYREMAEITALVRALSSGTLSTYDPRTQRVVDVSELEALQEYIADAWLKIGRKNRAEAMQKIDDAVARLLSPVQQEADDV
jgi:hypothetical protein